MLGGDESSRSRAERIVRTFAGQVVHVGPLGDASRMKLAVNLVLGLNRAVLAEGLAFAEAIGLDPRQALDVFRAGAAYSRVMDTKGEKMIRRDFTPEARLAQHHKDVLLILEQAAKSGMDLPLTEAHRGLLAAAGYAGHDACDNSAIIAAYRPR
jgi:3-hydroxyisobutyrate dehydrogenase-like beta-hydroxyacid dehydrogenase